LRTLSCSAALIFFSAFAVSTQASDLKSGRGRTTASMDSTADASLPPEPASGAGERRFPIGVGVKVSFPGIGAEAALALWHRSNVRFGLNAFNYDHTFDKDGVSYKGTLTVRSAQVRYDFFPIGGLHLSPGLLIYNGNKVDANASVPAARVSPRIIRPSSAIPPTLSERRESCR
jgi:hypothetical protein